MDHVYRMYDGKELVGVTRSCVIAYAVAETLDDPHVEDESGQSLHPAHREERGWTSQ